MAWLILATPPKLSSSRLKQQRGSLRTMRCVKQTAMALPRCGWRGRLSCVAGTESVRSPSRGPRFGVESRRSQRGETSDHVSPDDLWDELAYLAYHLHWDLDQLLDLGHRDRICMVTPLLTLTNERGSELVPDRISFETDLCSLHLHRRWRGDRVLRGSRLEFAVATEDVEEGGVNGYVHKLPGRMTWPNLVLKRADAVGQPVCLINSVSGDG